MFKLLIFFIANKKSAGAIRIGNNSWTNLNFADPVTDTIFFGIMDTISLF